jgi:N-acetylmuramoyl-L-alanine amidase
MIDLDGLEGIEINTFEIEKSKKKVAIDPGHGVDGSGNPKVDPGAIGNGYLEKDVALNISNSINEYLTKWNVRTVMTRTGDVKTNKEQMRYVLDVASDNDANIYLSIHLNASENNAASGFEILYNSLNPNNARNSLDLAEKIFENFDVLAKRSITDTGNKFAVLREFKGDATLIVEVGFISNKNDIETIISQMDEIGKQIASGVYMYLFNEDPIVREKRLFNEYFKKEYSEAYQQYLHDLVEKNKDNTRLGLNPMGGW